MRYSTAITMALLALAASAALAAPDPESSAQADWPQWRGPTRDGVAPQTLAPWPKDGPKVLWKFQAGSGYSSFVVRGDKVYTAGNQQNQDVVSCLNAATGEVIWKKSYPCDAGTWPGTRATPTLDGDNLYFFSRDAQLRCYKAADGTEVWAVDLKKELKCPLTTFGMASSPLVSGKNVIVNMGSFGTAIDKKKGTVAWTTGSGNPSYSTAVPFKLGQKDVLALVSAAFYIVDPATGAKILEHPWQTQHDCNAADPLIIQDRIFISSGYGHGCALLQIQGNAIKTLWENKEMRNHFNSSVLYQDHLYGFDGNARDKKASLKCLDLKDGTVKWSQQGLGAGSLILAGDKLLVLSEAGELLLVPASPKGFEPLARTQVLDNICWTPPVLAGGRMFLRNDKGSVVCLEAVQQK